MTGTAASLIVLAAATATIDWAAVARDWTRVETIAKPLVMALLIAATIAQSTGAVHVFIAVALLFSLGGDVMLLPAIDRFVHGLTAFLLAHVVYMFAFVVAGQRLGLLLVGIGITSLFAVRVGPPILRGAGAEDPRLERPVLAYVIVLATMAATAVGTGSALVLGGGLVFAVSDAVLGWNRFVEPLRHGRLATHVAYHLGQILIVAGVIA